MENMEILDDVLVDNGGEPGFFGAADPMQSLRNLLDMGGPVVAILLVFSVITLAVIVLKIIQLRSAIMPPKQQLAKANAAYANGAVDKAIRLYRSLPGAVAYLSAIAVESKYSNLEAGIVREKIAVAARGAIASMRSHLRVLEVISQVAPLLGLLGTILGMIEVFKVLEGAGDVVSPSELAGGIWVALMTTATGLGVAIPAAIALQWFDGIIENEAQTMEENVAAIILGHRLPEPGQTVTANISTFKDAIPVAGE
ncbi:MAG: MotA/TolQ/ExbB proton channel family protein [Rhizobiales bacterium]|nr:MotA/TolQ/ExbB proton channel family protein [Hyphomicrobiales bacterium]